MIRALKKWLIGYKEEARQTEEGRERIASLQKAPLPRHVAIIMDGNGRWAKKRGLPRVAGHRAGMKTVRRITRAADDLGIEALTLYSFSTENWKRPKDEVNYLMGLPEEFLRTDLDELVSRNIRVRMLGEEEGLPEHTLDAIRKFKEATKENTGMILSFALNYGSRAEIIHAIERIIDDMKSGKLSKDVLDESLIGQYLYTADLPDPDLMIRTSGEVRISNFMLWQLAYSELWFTDVQWPDFSKEMFYQAIEDFQRRSRRYGAV
ncbi:undecaprenyl diphosphate synthase [Melghirimyces profundicolus]|uniref:Isoprenyl transferase n=1 Tax=Melghirimyces profundicolus TaxID=1242148 RepID=A0A2T6BRB0_9BACL|nr:isoprenyl transferase [Melghirimyces profundicolus]PTX58613.1 undecaprenyl diphosphate synthase [Melghirimyces profundicolus]